MPRLVFDIETGGLPEEQLRTLYRDQTFDEFCSTCDQQWKPETKQQKYEEAKAAGWQQFVDRAALSPITGQVVAIGLQREDYPNALILGANGEPEFEQLNGFWVVYRKYQSSGGKMIGFNSNGFDLPFLIRRSWWYQIPVPDGVIDFRGYFSPVFIDLRKVWGCGDYKPSGSLDDLCRFFNVGGKPDDCTGAGFAKLWRGSEEDRAKAVNYLANDLAMTLNLAKRMGVIQ